MEFWKMHGLKNDYIFVQTFTQAGPGDPAEAARALSAPHTGIGADGLILVEPDREADARMRIFNADGSEAQICGNGLRCAARLLYDQGLVTRPEMTISTGSGLRQVWLHIERGAVTSVTADMGAPVIGEAVELTGAGRTLRFVPVSMGNPHAVTFDEPARGDAFYRLGPAFERHPAFPQRANIEFAAVTGPEDIAVRVWERGSGETMACGSGACAVLAAASSLGLTGPKARVTLPGGALWLERRDDGHILMTGPATYAFRGSTDVPD